MSFLLARLALVRPQQQQLLSTAARGETLLLSVWDRRLCDHSGGSGYVRGERPPVASIGWVGV